MPNQKSDSWKPLPLLVMTPERVAALKCVLDYAEMGYCAIHVNAPAYVINNKPKEFAVVRELIGESKKEKGNDV